MTRAQSRINGPGLCLFVSGAIAENTAYVVHLDLAN